MQRATRLPSLVSPPSIQCSAWWTSMKRSCVQPGKAQPPSRAMTARRRAGGMRRVLRPMSRMWPCSSRAMPVKPQSHARRRSGRVAPGDRSPGAPTDPDVRISRIRLLGLRVRCAQVDAVNDTHRRQRKALQQALETWPWHARPRSPVQPLAPDTFDRVHEESERPRVTGDTEIRVVTTDFPREHAMLVTDRGVSVDTAPVRDALHRAVKSTRCGLAAHHPFPLRLTPQKCAKPSSSKLRGRMASPLPADFRRGRRKSMSRVFSG